MNSSEMGDDRTSSSSLDRPLDGSSGDFYLSGIYIYPIKSAAGIAVDLAAMTPRGLQYDRRWMITTPDGHFMTQRQFPQMALLQVQIHHNTLIVSVPKLNPALGALRLTLPTAPEKTSGEVAPAFATDTLTVEVWGDRCLAWSMGDEAALWLSKALNTPCQLVYMPDESDRPTDHGQIGAEHQVSFADAYPYLLISEASLDDLNQRLSTPVSMNRFRPNLVVRGCEPFAEDRWSAVIIGNQTFRVAKSCSRCTVTTVDQTTGERYPEPLKTLATYRYWDGKIWFGQNLVHHTLGTLAVGDRLTVIDASR